MRVRHRIAKTAALTVLALILFAVALPIAAAGETAALRRQTRGYSQAFQGLPGAWGDDPLGTAGCPDRLATTGCLVTAFACVLEYYGLEVELPASGGRISGSDPGALNAWLKENDGFGHCTSDAFGNCCLEWSHLPSELVLHTYYNVSETGMDAQATARIARALEQGKPVLAGVHWGVPCGADPNRSEDCHWIVITAQAHGTTVILDTYNPDFSSPYAVRTTLERGVHGSYVIDRYVVVEAPELIPASTSVVVSLAPGSGISPGSPTQLVVQTSDVAIESELFLTAVDPRGVSWTLAPDSAAADGRWIRATTPTGWHVEPHDVRVWSVPLPTGIDAAEWTWNAWLSDPVLPGIPLAQGTQGRVVAAVSSPVSALGILAAIALFAATVTLMILVLNKTP